MPPADRSCRWRWSWLLPALLLGLAPSVEARPLDHYVLALSWSPTFCASEEAADEALQCGRSAAYAFIVHGLWPQYRGGRLEYCRGAERWVPEEMIAAMLPLMPSKRLVIHEWRKHGTCSGLSIRSYFTLLRRLAAKVRIPPRYRAPGAPLRLSRAALVADFVAANPGLEPAMITLACRRSRRSAALTDLRICFSPAGDFTRCSPAGRDDCQADTLLLPPVARTGEDGR